MVSGLTSARRGAAGLIAGVCLMFWTIPSTQAAQALTVLPVNIQMASGQMTTALTVINQGDAETSFQIRAFAWTQGDGGVDQLQPTESLLASPPLGTVAVGASQVVRMLLRRPSTGSESTYRILIDQIPPPAAPGVVRVALRLSIPIFAEPPARVAPHVTWQVQDHGSGPLLVAVNDGNSHLTVRDMTLSDAAGRTYAIERNVSPYILKGATRYWRITSAAPALGAMLRLTANTDTGSIDQSIRVVQSQ